MRKFFYLFTALVFIFLLNSKLSAQSWQPEFEVVKYVYFQNYFSPTAVTEDSAIYGAFDGIKYPGQDPVNFRYISRLNQNGAWVAGPAFPEFSSDNSSIISHAVNNGRRYIGVVQTDEDSTNPGFSSHIFVNNSNTNAFVAADVPVFNGGVRLFRINDRYFFLYGDFTRSRMGRTGSPGAFTQLDGAAIWDLQTNTPAAMAPKAPDQPGLGGKYVSHSSAGGTIFVATDKGFRVMQAGSIAWQDNTYPVAPAGGLFNRFGVFSANEVYGAWRRTTDGRIKIHKLGQGAWVEIAELTNLTTPNAPVSVNSMERLDEWLVITHTGTHFGTTPVTAVFGYNTLNGNIYNFGNPLPQDQIIESSFTRVLNGNLYFFTVNNSLASTNQFVYTIKFTAENAIEYEFTGNGNWSNPANWKKGFIPPSPSPTGKKIYINPAGDGECLLDKAQVLSPTSQLIIKDGKKFRVQGNITIQ